MKHSERFKLYNIFKIFKFSLIPIIPILMLVQPMLVMWLKVKNKGYDSIIEVYMVDSSITIWAPALVAVLILTSCLLIKNKYTETYLPVAINIVLDVILNQPVSNINPSFSYLSNPLEYYQIYATTGKGFLYVKCLLIAYLIFLYFIKGYTITWLEIVYIALTITQVFIVVAIVGVVILAGLIAKTREFPRYVVAIFRVDE